VRRLGKWLPLLLLSLGLLTLAGCGGMGGQPLSGKDLDDVKAKLVAIDGLNAAQLTAENKKQQADLGKALSAEKPDSRTVDWDRIQLGYTWERLAGVEGDTVDASADTHLRSNLREAAQAYQLTLRGPYGSITAVRLAQVNEYLIGMEQKSGGAPEAIAAYRKETIGALEQMANYPQGIQTLVRTPSVGALPGAAQWRQPNQMPELSKGKWPPASLDARRMAIAWLDPYYHDNWLYKTFQVLVTISGGAARSASYVIAIALIALLAKIITTPFSVAQFRNMRAMQKFQPELQKLQEKYKDDKTAMSRAQMELMKEHKINPMSSCLPMILQLVILWQVYYGIRHFLFNFAGVHFLYITSLSEADAIQGTPYPGPLVILYAISMYFTQKLISMPAATPEQQQQQRMMSIMMPVMLLFFMKSLPAAFILYWFLQNVLMTGHQWLIMRPHREADIAAARAAATARAETKAKGEALPPPPPAAIERLAQGSKGTKKKKGRRP
jgi:YidC/Oxa1 family membrane protein insertase